jgi:Uma2 family endonuclease
VRTTGPETAGRAAGDAAAEDELDLVAPPDVEILADDLLVMRRRAPLRCIAARAGPRVRFAAMHALEATASPLVRRYTLEEFHALEPPPGGGHWELIAGVLYMVPPPSRRHADAVSRLVLVFAAYAAAHPDRCRLFVPRASLSTPADTHLEPDLFLVATERLSRMGDENPTSADLVVEVLSPSTAVYDRTAKADTYAALGVRELWLVDLEQETIEQRVLAGGRWETRGSSAGPSCVGAITFPGLPVVAAEVFRRS